MKKQLSVLAAAALALLAALVIYKSTLYEATGQRAPDGTIVELNGVWTEPETQADGTLLISYNYQVPPDSSFPEAFLLTQSYWTNFEVLCNGESLYTHFTQAADGYTHLFALDELLRGERLTIVFRLNSANESEMIKSSRFYVGNQSGIYNKILLENLYAFIFALVAVIMSAAAIGLSFVLRRTVTQHSHRITALGIFIFSAGIWVLTDSNLLLLVTARTAIVSAVSFISFFAMPIFLLMFTRQIVSVNERVYRCLIGGFCAFLGLYALNYIFDFFRSSAFLVFEHALLIITMLIIAYYGLRALRKKRTPKLVSLLCGYLLYFLGSLASIAMFYSRPFSGYSRLYALGAAGFVVFLFDAACRETYEQLGRNLKLEARAKLAYSDAMTGIGNRAAFHEKQVRDAGYTGSIAYLMVDINNLKEANDKLGHAAGDELITRTAQCLAAAVGQLGSCYRIGGDEFIACMNNVSEAQAQKCAQSFYALVEADNAAAQLPLSAAAGCVWSGEAGQDLDLLFRQADAAMYKEKQRIKGTAARGSAHIS